MKIMMCGDLFKQEQYPAMQLGEPNIRAGCNRWYGLMRRKDVDATKILAHTQRQIVIEQMNLDIQVAIEEKYGSA